ncbi:MAG: hypothetical protein GY950_23465 [bacterium]|nr:hypothetical protein [bacterium]
MNEKTKNSATAQIFKKEHKVLDKALEIQETKNISTEELSKAYLSLSRHYEKMLKEIMKITRIGDVHYKKLMAANDRIQEQKNQLENLNKKLRRANAVKDKFYSIIAHDLKDPFQVLLISSEVLADDFKEMEETEVKKYVEGIHKTAANLAALLQNLLQWSRSQYGEIRCLPRKIDLFALVAEHIDYFNGNAQSKNIRLQSHIPGDTFVCADENMIKSVFRNLISNAVKFTPPGGTVTLSVKEDHDFVVTSVSDTGVGIPEEKLADLFNSAENSEDTEYIGSHTTIGTAKEKGTGLGLMLCKEFVEKNGGSIHVTSQVGKGSVFEFSLPKTGTAKGE